MKEQGRMKEKERKAREKYNRGREREKLSELNIRIIKMCT